ncbi:MAG: hypothetical protein R2879_10425 [Saprospiraceae bacterium]
MNWTNNLLSFLQPISIIIAAGTAIYGIDSWRREARWKMKNEVSQDTLEILYSVRESIKKIRDPRVFPHEQIEVKTLNNNQQSLSTSQVIHYRINNEMEKLNKLSSLKFKYMAVVSPESEKEFGSIFKIINSIGFNAQMVDELRAARTPGKFGDDNSLLERLERSEEIIWHMEGDKIEKDINQLISKFERRQVELNKKTFILPWR